MKNFKNNFITGLFLLMTTMMLAQGKIKGQVTDGTAGMPGVNVAVKGDKAATSTDFDGKFTINTAATSGQIVISYLGFEPKTVNFKVAKGETVDLGKIKLTENSNELTEVVVKSTVIDVAKDRKTPVAVSTIKAAEIQEKLGNQEFPEVLKSTPSVYTSKSGGGFGDSRITIRGFAQENVAVMINGVPVNDMENGRVFWSNWAGLSDVTSAMQVQRGLGSSKLVIASVGGTINVLTKTSDMKQGGVVATAVGNDNYVKTTASYNTGVMSNGLSASVLLSRTSGAGYVNGTSGVGSNYFFALGYKPNKNHDIQLTFTGAPQWHNNRFAAISIATAIGYGTNGDPNRKYNADWGYLNGKEFDMRRNYYHKPVASINWDWKINESTKLSTVLYGSWGRGAGSTGAGAIKGFNYLNAAFRKADGTVDYDKIQSYNSGTPTLINNVLSTRTTVLGQYENILATTNNTSNGISRISSFNSHDWYGGVIDLNHKLTKELTLDFGVDARTYTGIHYQNVNDLLGGQRFKDVSDVNNPVRYITETYAVSPSYNPFANASVEQKIGYDQDGKVNWLGAFTQLEYATENLTAYVQGAFSQQGFKRVDRFLYTPANPLSETSFENINGWDVKAGANYNINKNHNLYANAGLYSKQPFFSAVYPNNKSIVNGNLTNEKITGYEFGYGFTTTGFTAKFNGYYTEWKDRYQRANDPSALNPGGYFDFSGITEIHSGVELELNAVISPKFKANAMISIGDWNYKGNSTSNVYDASNNPFAGAGSTTLYLDGVKVGNSAQTTAAIGATYEVLPRFKVDASYNYIDKLYANILPANFASPTNLGSLVLPSYGLTDLGLSYKLLVGRDNASSINFRANVNNLLDEYFIAESSSNQFASTETEFTTSTGNGAGLYSALPVTPAGKYASYADYQNRGLYKGVDVRNSVYFGFGRTWNFGISYKF